MDVLDPTDASTNTPDQKQDDLLVKFKEVASQLILRKVFEKFILGTPADKGNKPEGKSVFLRIREVILNLVEIIKSMFVQLGWFRKASTAE